MPTNKIFLLLTLTLLISGCVSTRIQSSKAANYLKEPKRIYTIVEQAKWGDGFYEELGNSLSYMGAQCDATFLVGLTNSQEQEENKHSRGMFAMNADALMVVDLTHITTGEYGIIHSAKFDIQLFDVENNFLVNTNNAPLVWRAIVRSTPTFSTSSQAGISMGETLVTRMAEDEIFKNCDPEPPETQ